MFWNRSKKKETAESEPHGLPTATLGLGILASQLASLSAFMPVLIPFKRLDERAKPPCRAHEGDAGFDVTAIEVRKENGVYIYRTGLAFAVPKGCWLDARARSSIYKTGLILCNGIGTIDSSYRGEVGAMFYAAPGVEENPYKPGDRIFQLVPMPCRADQVKFIEVQELPESWDGRGKGGFGSTGV